MGLEKPTVLIIKTNDDSVNLFADVIFTSFHAIAITKKLIQEHPDDEIIGGLGHELGHFKYRKETKFFSRIADVVCFLIPAVIILGYFLP